MRTLVRCALDMARDRAIREEPELSAARAGVLCRVETRHHGARVGTSVQTGDMFGSRSMRQYWWCMPGMTSVYHACIAMSNRLLSRPGRRNVEGEEPHGTGAPCRACANPRFERHSGGPSRWRQIDARAIRAVSLPAARCARFYLVPGSTSRWHHCHQPERMERRRARYRHLHWRGQLRRLSLIHISEPTRRTPI